MTLHYITFHSTCAYTQHTSAVTLKHASHVRKLWVRRKRVSIAIAPHSFARSVVSGFVIGDDFLNGGVLYNKGPVFVKTVQNFSCALSQALTAAEVDDVEILKAYSRSSLKELGLENKTNKVAVKNAPMDIAEADSSFGSRRIAYHSC